MAVVEIKEKDFVQEVLKSDKPVLVDFFATWCGPCKMLSPVVDQISEERPDVKFVKVDVDEAGDIAAQYKIMSIPTLIVFKDGQVAAQTVGVQPKAGILAMLG